MTKEIHDINTRALDFVVELIEYLFEYPDDDYMTMECLCRKLFKYGLIDKKDGYYLVADDTLRKTEQTDAEITELAKEIVHKMIDDAVIAEDAYPDLRQKMHDAVERLDEYYLSEDERNE